MKSNMKDDLIVIFLRMDLIFYSNPAMAFILFCKINGSHGVGKTEEQLVGVFVPGNTLFNKIHFVGKHLNEPFLSDITSIRFYAIDRVTEVLIISTHSFGDGSGPTPGSKKITYRFLTCSYF